MAIDIDGRSGGKQVNYPGDHNYNMLLRWELISQNKTTNKSVVRATLYLTKDGSGTRYHKADTEKYIIVDGVRKTNKTKNYDTNDCPVQLMQGDFSVSHDADGNGSFAIAARHYSGTGLGTATISGTKYKLQKMDRFSDIGTVTVATTQSGYPTSVKVAFTKLNSKYTYNLNIRIGGLEKNIKGYNSNTAVNFTTEELSYLVSTYPSSYQMRIILTTYSGNTVIGESTKTNTYGIIKTKVYLKINETTWKTAKLIYVKPTKDGFKLVKSTHVKPSTWQDV